jgi:asparagine synthase (glutamine-hydrolysing)
MSRYAKLIKKFRFLSLINDINNLRNVRPVTTLNILQGIFFQILPDPILRFAGNIRSSSDQIKKLIDFNRSELRFSHPHDLIPVRYQSVPEISEHLMFYSTLPKYLKWEDRNSMANSVEARVPFLDHRLVEFSYNLPDEFLEKDGINKRVLREAMTDLLPVQIKNRKDKMGFITPEELWVKRDNTAWFRQKLEEAVEVSSGIVTPESLIYFDNVVNETIPFDYTYWRLILFSEWIQKFQVST